MKIHKLAGFWLAVEGLDGSDSDKVAKLLIKKLKKEGLSPILVKEPTNGPVGKIIRQFLKKTVSSISPLLFKFLFAADREWLMNEKILPALKKGKCVVSDRCLWSSIAYQSLDLPIHWLLEVDSRFYIPNMTYFIDVPPEICAKKIKTGKDEYQLFSTEERLVQIQDGYHWIFQKYPYWFRIIDGEKEKEEMIGEIFSHLRRFQKFKKLKAN